MASDLSSALDEFVTFVSRHLANSGELTLEEGLERFRHYQNELASARQKLQEAEEQIANGESGPLDVDALKAEVRQRLAADGVID